MSHDHSIEFFPDPLAAFNEGCVMDLRFRTAMQFCHGLMTSGVAMEYTPEQVSAYALNLADDLFAQGKSRGLIAPLPEGSELNAATKRHLERNVHMQLYQQQYAQREQSGAVRPIMNG